MRGQGRDMKKMNADIFQAVVSPTGMRVAAAVAAVMLAVLIVLQHNGTCCHLLSGMIHP